MQKQLQDRLDRWAELVTRWPLPRLLHDLNADLKGELSEDEAAELHEAMKAQDYVARQEAVKAKAFLAELAAEEREAAARRSQDDTVTSVESRAAEPESRDA